MNPFEHPFIACLLTLLMLAFAIDVVASSLDIVTNVSTERFNHAAPVFTKNQGQWDEKVKFRTSSGGATLWITEEGVYYQFTRRIERDNAGIDDPMRAGVDEFDHEPDSIEQLVIKASFTGANSDLEVVGEGLMDYRCNYFIGNDPSRWHTDVPNYESVTLRNLYDGVDLRFYGGADGTLRYSYSIAPDADAGAIGVEYECPDGVQVDESGKVATDTRFGEITGLLAPPAGDGDAFSAELSMVPIDGGESDSDGRSSGSRNPDGVVLAYSTYLGGSSVDIGEGIAVDGSGSAYVTGHTYSSDFPTQNPYQTYQASYDVFVTKLSSSGNSLIYSTYLGGNDRDEGYGIAVDGSGSAYVTGNTNSTDFPTQNPYQTDRPFTDVFVTKLSSSGNSLIYSTYLGGNSGEEGFGIAVDGSASAYVTGNTNSTDFPTQNPYQTDQDYTDVFVTRLSSSGNSLIYSTYLGGNDGEEGFGIAVDGSGSAYVTGYTYSSDFPTQNPYQMDQAYEDVFVTRLSSSGNSLIYSTYLGGNDRDYGQGIAVDGSGDAYLTGYTWSTDFPTQNPFQTNQEYYDVFVTKLSSSGNSLIYSTYLGGNLGEDGRGGIAVDGSGCAYVTGITDSPDFPTQNPYQTDQVYEDVFVTKLSSSGNSLIYSTYLGGSSGEEGDGIAVDGSGNAYVTGGTNSTDFPTQNPYQTDQGGPDVFVTKLMQYTCGDADNSGGVDIDDVVFEIAYVFSGGPAPSPLAAGDADCSGAIDIDDVVYVISYIFSGGPAPCDPDNNGVPNC